MINIYEAVKCRRSYYEISKESTISDDQIIKVVKDAVKYTPTAFNSQSARVTILFGQQHEKLWDITLEALRRIVPAESFEETKARIHLYRNGYGTILYYEDQEVITSLQQRYEIYKENFPVWSNQSNAMLQMVVWTELEVEGLGATLQHYTELIEEEVKKEYQIPGNWKMIAQMPFGKPTKQPEVKDFYMLEEHVRIMK